MSSVRRLVKRSLLRRNAILSRPPGQFSLTEFKLQHARDRGLRVDMAVDGGAASGAWTQEFKEVYPDAQVLCIEPRDDAQAALQSLATQLPGLHLAPTLIGAARAEVDFHEHGDQSSILSTSSGATFGRVLRTRIDTLDGLIRDLGLPLPDLIKLDLQGAELQALEGARECLGHAEAVLMEVSFIPFQQDNPLIADVLAFMKSHGFRSYDVFALWHRPLDGALAQGDFLFLREDSNLLADRRWALDATWS